MSSIQQYKMFNGSSPANTQVGIYELCSLSNGIWLFMVLLRICEYYQLMTWWGQFKHKDPQFPRQNDSGVAIEAKIC